MPGDLRVPGRYLCAVAFNVPADAYDRFMGRYSRRLASQMADLAGVQAGQRVVDVGCGPGALTEELVGRVGAEAVAAADPSEPFQRVAVGAAHGRVAVHLREISLETGHLSGPCAERRKLEVGDRCGTRLAKQRHGGPDSAWQAPSLDAA